MAAAKPAKKEKITTLRLRLDESDLAAVLQAVAYRRKAQGLPDGGGNLGGRLVAEICRGWLDMLGQWRWPGNPKPKPTREVKEMGGKRAALRIRKEG